VEYPEKIVVPTHPSSTEFGCLLFGQFYCIINKERKYIYNTK